MVLAPGRKLLLVHVNTTFKFSSLDCFVDEGGVLVLWFGGILAELLFLAIKAAIESSYRGHRARVVIRLENLGRMEIILYSTVSRELVFEQQSGPDAVAVFAIVPGLSRGLVQDQVLNLSHLRKVLLVIWLGGELDIIEECSSRLGSVHIHPLLKLIYGWWISLAEMLVHQKSVVQICIDLERG